MSLILDALKKSEQERRRERGPDLQSIHRPTLAVAVAPRRRGWLLVGAALVALNGAALAWWLLRDDPGATSIAAAPASNASMQPTPQPMLETVAPEPRAAQPAPTQQEILAPTTMTGLPSLATQQPSSQPAIPPRAGSAGDEEFMPVTPGASLPSRAPVQELWELPPAVRGALPPMTYSFHVYSSDPQRRTIIINNRRLREGDQVAEGLLLEEITPDGVVLATGGYRVHIAVLGDW